MRVRYKGLAQRTISADDIKKAFDIDVKEDIFATPQEPIIEVKKALGEALMNMDPSEWGPEFDVVVVEETPEEEKTDGHPIPTDPAITQAAEEASKG